MGIPGFFGWLLKKYTRNSITSTSIAVQIDELYIDANCMLHPSCFKVLNEVPLNISTFELEKLMIKTCIRDLDNLIKLVNPQKKLFIAVDGTAPVAKISQQRKRRYKSYSEMQMKNQIKSKYNIPLKKEWSNASITPGTQFMENLHLQLLTYAQSIKNITCIYSSYHTVGEGEHKIFDYIRDNNSTVTRVVYGLDADLIFLAMACNVNNIYLIRESTELGAFQTLSPYTYVSIDNLNTHFMNLINSELAYSCREIGIPNIYSKSGINDIIFICYLLGNDFLPHIPSIDIKRNGMDMLLSAYIQTYIKHQKPLVVIKPNIEINMLFFDDFLSQMVLYEKDYFENYEEQQLPREPVLNSKCDEELWKLDNMLIIPSIDIYKRHIGNFDDWKYRYYAYHIGCAENQESCIEDICSNYLTGIMWITKYYFGQCASWTWMYNYEYAPFISDLSKFIKTCHLNLNKINFEQNTPLKCLTQLLCVIPPIYSNLLPPEYAKLMTDENSKIADLFPTKFDIDTANKTMLWQCIPLLPLLTINRVIDATKSIKNTNEILNVQCNQFIFKNN